MHYCCMRAFTEDTTAPASPARNGARAEGDKKYRGIEAMAVPSSGSGMAIRRRQAIRPQMAMLFGKRPRASQHRKCRRLM